MVFRRRPPAFRWAAPIADAAMPRLNLTSTRSGANRGACNAARFVGGRFVTGPFVPGALRCARESAVTPRRPSPRLQARYLRGAIFHPPCRVEGCSSHAQPLPHHRDHRETTVGWAPQRGGACRLLGGRTTVP